MRNYVSTWWDKIEWTSDTDIGAIYTFGSDPDEMAANRAKNIAAAQVGQTNWKIDYEVGPFQAFMTLDKENISRLLRNNTEFIYISSLQGAGANEINWDPAVQLCQFVKETPRYAGWTDAEGNKRQAPPSDKKTKAPTPPGGLKLQKVTLLNILTQIYALLVVLPNPDRQTRKIIADILLAIQRIVAGTETAAQVDALFAELDRYGLTF